LGCHICNINENIERGRGGRGSYVFFLFVFKSFVNVINVNRNLLLMFFHDVTTWKYLILEVV